jgi:hypothetical protein
MKSAPFVGDNNPIHRAPKNAILHSTIICCKIRDLVSVGIGSNVISQNNYFVTVSYVYIYKTQCVSFMVSLQILQSCCWSVKKILDSEERSRSRVCVLRKTCKR